MWRISVAQVRPVGRPASMADSSGLCEQVLDTLCYADRTLLADNAALAGATVFVHLSSHVKVRGPNPERCAFHLL